MTTGPERRTDEQDRDRPSSAQAAARRDGTLFYASGGGFTGGGSPLPPNPEAEPWSYLLIEKGWALAGVGYGLAPEFKYPDHPEGDIRLATRHYREHQALWLGFDEPRPLVHTGKSAGATAMARNSVDATHEPAEQADAQILFLGITNHPAVDQPFGDVWQHFEPGSTK